MNRMESLLKLLNFRLFKKKTDEVFYINGSETLPPPLPADREQY